MPLSFSTVKQYVTRKICQLKKEIQKEIKTAGYISNRLDIYGPRITHIITLSQSEYDAIPEEQRDDKIVYITYNDEEGE